MIVSGWYIPIFETGDSVSESVVRNVQVCVETSEVSNEPLYLTE